MQKRIAETGWNSGVANYYVISKIVTDTSVLSNGAALPSFPSEADPEPAILSQLSVTGETRIYGRGTLLIALHFRLSQVELELTIYEDSFPYSVVDIDLILTQL